MTIAHTTMAALVRAGGRVRRAPWVAAFAMVVPVTGVALWWLWPADAAEVADQRALAVMRTVAAQVAADPSRALPEAVSVVYAPAGVGQDRLTGKLFTPASPGRCAVVDVTVGGTWLRDGTAGSLEVSTPTLTTPCPQG